MERPRGQREQARTLLMRSDVCNAAGIVSTRYTEYQGFELWAHLLRSRHGLAVTGATPCVWLPEREFEKRRSLLDRRYELRGVTCIVVSAFNPQTRITEHKTRYVATVDWPVVGELVRAHLHVSEQECTEQIYSGVALATSRTAEASHAA